MYKVYLYTSPSNKSYCGITSRTLKQRAGNNGIHYQDSPYFYNAIKKYGFENFTVKVLFDNLTHEEANKKEQQIIEEMQLRNPRFGYNISKGGDGVDSDTVSQKNKERFSDPKEREKISLKLKEWCQTKEGIDFHKKIAESNKIKFGTQVVQFNLATGEPINIFPSYCEAVFSFTGKRHGSCVSRVVNGERSQYKGFGWRKPTLEDLKFFNIKEDI